MTGAALCALVPHFAWQVQHFLHLRLILLSPLASHFAWQAEAPSAAPATQNETQVEKVLHLPGKMRHNCTKCCTCHAKQAASSGRQNVHPCPREAPSAAPAMQNETQVEKVLHLPRKMRHKCTKCCTCHAKQAASSGRQSVHPCPCEAPSAAPATQKRRRHPDARAYITAPVRLQVLRLPRKMRRKRLQVLRLPRKMRRKWRKCCTCHAK